MKPKTKVPKTKPEKWFKKALKKISKKRRKVSLEALEQFNRGAVMKVGEDVDNAELIKRINNGEIFRQI